VIKLLLVACIALVLTACGGALPTPAPTPGQGETPNPVPIVKPTQDARYGAAPDFSWARGQLQMTQGRDNTTCWILQYDPQGADEYGGRLYLVGMMPDIFKPNDFVQVRGQFDTSMGPGTPPCDATPYRFTSIEAITGGVPGSAATPAPQPTQDLTQPPGRPTAAAQFGHADDYRWVRGFIKFGAVAACNAIIYGDEEKDAYGGKLVLRNADLSTFRDGDFVTVYGQLDANMSDQPPCQGFGQGYFVTRIERQGDPPAASDDQRYGHAADYSWLRGQVNVTAIQGGCTFLVYDPLGADQYGGKVVPLLDRGELKHGEFVTLIGGISDEPGPMCPGVYYKVTSIERQ
jgi:hypothetical protein